MMDESVDTLEEMLKILSSHPDVRVKAQQREEQDLTPQEKTTELRDLLKKSPSSFLSRFGPFLSTLQLAYFESNYPTNFEIKFYLQELQKNSSEMNKKVKNRRYEALHRMVDNSDYFTEEEMQRRAPILYDQLIGRYHSALERAAFLRLSSQSSSATPNTPLSDIFLAHMSRDEGEVSDRRKGQEDQVQNELNAEEEDFDDDEEGEGDVQMSDKRPNLQDLDKGAEEEIEDDEKELLKEEFYTTMYRNFLEGKDEEFDYKSIDENPAYDLGEVQEQDDIDKYFDEESPAEVLNSESSSVQSLEIEGMHNLDKKPEKKVEQVPYNDDEEDELDQYMKSIEVEVIGQKVEKL